MPESSPTVNPNQLTLAGLFWITTAIALLLGYAIQQGPDAVWQAGFTALFAIVCGLLVGCIRKDWNNAFFWGGLYAMLGFLAVAGGRLPHWSVGLGWGLVGASVGSCVGVDFPRKWWLGILFSMILGTLAMASVVLIMRQHFSDMIMFDTIIAGVVGGLLKPLTMLLQWLEKNSGQPRYLLASWLAICILIGNFLVPVLAGIQR